MANKETSVYFDSQQNKWRIILSGILLSNLCETKEEALSTADKAKLLQEGFQHNVEK